LSLSEICICLYGLLITKTNIGDKIQINKVKIFKTVSFPKTNKENRIIRFKYTAFEVRKYPRILFSLLTCSASLCVIHSSRFLWVMSLFKVLKIESILFIAVTDAIIKNEEVSIIFCNIKERVKRIFSEIGSLCTQYLFIEKNSNNRCPKNKTRI